MMLTSKFRTDAAMLRDYQRRAIDDLYSWFDANEKGHPCLVMPTGSGKSHVIAELCREALQHWPGTRILMLTHVKELIQQNAAKLRAHWPDAPLGIYSAGLRQRVISEPITFAGIQSVRHRAADIGHVDLAIIDECHLVSHKQEGSYRRLIDDLTRINTALRVIGLTATPYRLGHGLITDAPALFAALIEPVSIAMLVHHGYLAPLRSKVTGAALDISGVHKRGGEFIESELQAAVNRLETNQQVAAEIVERAGERRAWIVFCTGVAHAEAMRDALRSLGIDAQCITGETPPAERDAMIRDFRAGRIRALTNANVLTTGFDYPDVDLLALVRPTMSTSLYMQMVGRGMRVKSHTDHCLVLDFAGNIMRHGPVTDVEPSGKPSPTGRAPVKVCKACGEICHAAVKVCPACQTEFPPPKPKSYELSSADIMGAEPIEMKVTEWRWREQISFASGLPMLVVTYYSGIVGPSVKEHVLVWHAGKPGEIAGRTIAGIASMHGTRIDMGGDIAGQMNALPAPSMIRYRKDGKFTRVIERRWDQATPDSRPGPSVDRASFR